MFAIRVVPVVAWATLIPTAEKVPVFVTLPMELRATVALVTSLPVNDVVEIDVGTRKVTREVSLGPTPYGISVASDGRIFVTRLISPVNEGQVWVVSPDAFTLKKTISLAEADDLLAVAEKKRLKIGVAHQMRLAPNIQSLKARLGDGVIGDLLQIRAHGKQDTRAGGEDMLVLGTHLFEDRKSVV